MFFQESLVNLEWLDLSFNKIEKIFYLYLLTTLLKNLFTMYARKSREPGVVGPELQQD
jgi:hypothetical protein